MKTIAKVKIYSSPPEVVFQKIDDLGVTGMHMTKSSMMMMGSKLDLEYLTESRKGLGTRYRWKGKMMGMIMDFTVEVTEWVYGSYKTWETIGHSKLIIYSWYRMHLEVLNTPRGTLAELSITYKRPKGFFYEVLSFLFADLYCWWCLKHMLDDAEIAVNKI